MEYLYVTVCLPTGNCPLVDRGLFESGLFGQLGLGSVQLTKDFLSLPVSCWAFTVWDLGHPQAKIEVEIIVTCRLINIFQLFFYVKEKLGKILR